jgi:hypothetical protein
MSADDDDSESEEKEKKGYSFLLRFAVFIFIAGPASVFAFGIYGRVALKNTFDALERGEFKPAVILLFWIGGLIGTAHMCFKK